LQPQDLRPKNVKDAMRLNNRLRKDGAPGRLCQVKGGSPGFNP